jgi:hypothetical protein
MTLADFKFSLSQPEPPDGLSALLKALWYEGKNNWEQAHNIAQDVPSAEGSWVHAYLHRKEGDQGNAAYWYHRAGKPLPLVSHEKEWEQIVSALLADHV